MAQSAKYRLTRIAQSVLNTVGLDAKEQHRTVWCGRSMKRGEYGSGEGGYVDVYRNPDRDGASFAGLTRCGNVHTCPDCSAKVSERRRKQLSAASVRHVKDNNGAAYLLTFTFPHEAEFGEDSEARLNETLKKFGKAVEKFKNGRKWKAFKAAAGNILTRRKNKKGECEEVITAGVVTSLEFTVSVENGWHPHIHMLVFCKKKGFGQDEKTVTEETGLYCKDDVSSWMIDDLKREWVNHLFKAGLGDHTKLTDMMKRALNVRGGEKAAEYIAKMGREQTIFVDDEGNKVKRWSLSREIACTHAKTGAAGERWGVQHVTPFQLLAWCEKQDNETEEQRKDRCWAYHRFRDYAAAVEGKKALSWSRGLKAALGVEDVDEDEWIKSDQPMPEQLLVGSITAKQFSELLKKKHGIQKFLEYVATCCDTQEHIEEYMEMITGMPDVAGGAMLIKRKHGRVLLE